MEKKIKDNPKILELNLPFILLASYTLEEQTLH